MRGSVDSGQTAGFGMNVQGAGGPIVLRCVSKRGKGKSVDTFDKRDDAGEGGRDAPASRPLPK